LKWSKLFAIRRRRETRLAERDEFEKRIHDMTATRRPCQFGLDLTVFRLDPEIAEGQRDVNDADADGHFISYMIAPMARNMTCRVTLCCGMDHEEAATVLRKLADRIEQHGPQLLNLDSVRLGHFDSKGVPVDDSNSLEPSEHDDDPSTEEDAKAS
jgi:hypothetical protein